VRQATATEGAESAPEADAAAQDGADKDESAPL
jgi:hypothetical protein